MSNLEYEQAFVQKVTNALEQAKKVLEVHRRPRMANEVTHKYNDKFLLAEFLTNTALATYVNAFSVLNINEETLQRMKQWSESKNVSLRLKSEETCKFVRERTRNTSSDYGSTSKVVELAGRFGFTKRIIHSVTEYVWKLDIVYELFVYAGNNLEDRIVIQSGKGSSEFVTSVQNPPPQPVVMIQDPIEINLTWFLKQFNDKMQLSFKIDRTHEKCKTPKNNVNVLAALDFAQRFNQWSEHMNSYFLERLYPRQSWVKKQDLQIHLIHTESIFNPILPLFVHKSRSKGKKSASKESVKKEEITDNIDKPDSSETPKFGQTALSKDAVPISDYLMSVGDINLFLVEHERTLQAQLKVLKDTIPINTGFLVGMEECQLILFARVIQQNYENYSKAIQFIEQMLYAQLVQAIGKVVSPMDFTEYMVFHNRKLFRPVFEPVKFSYDVRRPNYYPEGVISIERKVAVSATDGLLHQAIDEPIQTVVYHSQAKHAMRFPINAAIHVSFFGDRYLHSFVGHQFSASEPGVSLISEYSLRARARQFSCFVLIIGRISSADLFDPKYAIIIENKDDLLIPLLFEQIPSAKEFKKAVESLSPEQRAFASAYRSMQLESTLFGVCALQIKPQLEKALNLENTSLTTEIQLTHDLLDLFINYQIPTDLLSFEGSPDLSAKERVQVVQQNVNAIKQVIEDEKQEQLRLARLKKEMEERLEMERLLKEIEEKRIQDEISCYSKLSCEMLMEGGSVIKRKKSSGIAQKKYKEEKYKEEERCVDKKMKKPSSSAKLSRRSSISEELSGGAPPPSLEQASNSNNNNSDFGGNSNATNVDDNVVVVVNNEEPSGAEETPKEFSIDVKGGNPLEGVVDYTTIPELLNTQFELLDIDNSVRPTIITPSETWTKSFQRGLLGKPETTTLGNDQQRTEKNKAFDLLDSLTRSGVLPIDYASLHVVIASTHCFDRSVIGTLVADNVNPIVKVERSTLIAASTIHQLPVSEMIKEEHAARVQAQSPMLFPSSL